MARTSNSIVNRNQRQGTESAHRLARLATRQTVKRQRRVWSLRAASWDQHGSAGLGAVTAAVIEAAAVRPGDQVVDLGSGQGQISLPLARRGADVLAVDVSPAMVTQLRMRSQAEGVQCLAAVSMSIEELALPPASVDLVVSSYALHHLRDADKAELIAGAFGWLRPGGRLVLADMMFGRGGSSRDREIIRRKVVVLARKGPGGWWRIAKNAARYLLRVQECPVSMEAWQLILDRAGFVDGTATAIVAEAGLVTGRRPAGPEGGPAGPALPPAESS
jgi:2-polyprenyl-3-methyl-5-hydroxy-6-metoxy-1,4-benzoquinol methylase